MSEWTWEKVDEMQEDLAAHRKLAQNDQPKPTTSCTHPPEDRCSMCKPTGEWTVEEGNTVIGNGWRIETKFSTGADTIADAHNAALESAKRECAKEIAAEREHGMDDLRALTHATIDRLAKENDQLKQQLAAERDDRISWQELYEKTNEQLAAAVGPLKEARETMAARNGVGQFDDEIERIDAALAKVKL